MQELSLFPEPGSSLSDRYQHGVRSPPGHSVTLERWHLLAGLSPAAGWFHVGEGVFAGGPAWAGPFAQVTRALATRLPEPSPNPDSSAIGTRPPPLLLTSGVEKAVLKPGRAYFPEGWSNGPLASPDSRKLQPPFLR